MGGRTERSGAFLRWLVVVTVPTALVGLHSVLYGRWIVDDAAITFAYARSIATGAGPVLQPGAEAVEGYSNPAWLALFVAGRRLGLFDNGTWFGVPDYVAFPKLLALLCCAGMFACYYVVAWATTARPVLVTLVAGAVTAAVPSFVIWTTSGLENSLLALAAVAIGAVLTSAVVSGRLLAYRPALLCGLLAAAAALTRPDGLVYAAGYPLAVLLVLCRDQLRGGPLRGGRPHRGRLRRAGAALAVHTVAFAVPAGLYLTWRLATFGAYLPNTAVAKSQGLPGLASVARPGELAGYAGWLAVLVLAAGVVAALSRPWPGRAGLVVLLVPLALAVAAYAVLEPDWMRHYRFATAVWALAAPAGVVALARVWAALAGRGRALVAVAVAVAAVSSGSGFAESLRSGRDAPVAPMCTVAQNTGRTMNGYAGQLGLATATVAAPDIGGAALTSRLRIVDLAGLADARIAWFWSERDWPGLRDHLFEQVRPTFIKSHGGWSGITGLTADPRLAADYAEIITVARSTDWVRRDQVTAPGRLAALRRFAAEVTGPADERVRAAPRSSCGAVLAP